MKISRSALLAYSAQQMYKIVADVQQYPDFLNWCDEVTVLDEQENTVTARMHIAYSKLNIRFTTRNQNTPTDSIAMSLVDGPFSNFDGLWQFKQLGDSASKVSIEMNFNFDNSLAPNILGKVFEKVISMQLESFQKRAQQLHGKSAQD
ncbi:MAG: ribosome-associated toxin RatA of RatAB toxin-antitoxin module [Arenicella sp.]|jgi:ribosome-associated toxin RatA of RatAB toxin-antitoxin module